MPLVGSISQLLASFFSTIRGAANAVTAAAAAAAMDAAASAGAVVAGSRIAVWRQQGNNRWSCSRLHVHAALPVELFFAFLSLEMAPVLFPTPANMA